MDELNKLFNRNITRKYSPPDVVDEFVWVFLEPLKEARSLPFLQAREPLYLRSSHCLCEEFACGFVPGLVLS